ncbi:hypothetical protein PR202_ga20197 [Eleusine coracana subsp. coracana]|uniref:Kinetochore protein Spc24 n=1 Tax=Eleusine coracana subsp. coracana TaxID=191504 RepID=A0AAV5CXK3_ELECO|nr:hypothetical protein PR202_ga20197 [Eleusine coracana subsp. coracana]
MAAVADKRMGVDEIFSYADDLLPLIDGSEYGEAVAQADAVARMLQSVCVSEFNNLELQMKEVRDEVDKLEHQSVSIEESMVAIKKKERDMRKAEKTLSMCVSVTKIMPNLEDQDKISGCIVDKNKKKLQIFRFEKTASPVEICNELWKKI